MLKKAVIFDLDGTLLDTLDSLHTSVNLTLDRLGLSHVTKSQCRDFIGNGARVLVEKSLNAVRAEVNEDFLDRAMEIFKELFETYCTYKVVPYDGVLELLSSLKAKGCKLCVLTNKIHEQAVVAVEEIFGKNTFDLVQGQVSGSPRKPDPVALLNVINKLGLTPDECVFVGDSEVDIKTGQRAKVFTIGVTWGFRDESVLKEERADVVIHNVREIESLLEGKLMLEAYKPNLEDLWFREKLLADKDTMSYNNAWGGVVSFPKEDWETWYKAWVNGSKLNTFYRYLREDESDNFVGEIAYHFDKSREIYICSVIILAEHRNKGYGTQAINMICDLAKENGVSTLHDDIAADNPSVNLFLKNGFEIEFKNEEIVMVKKNL